ncbi:MAG: alpha/beta hydrolase family protein, partial [Flavisolibacter sp.]
MDWKTDVTLNTYLIQQMKKQYDNRRLEFDKAITSRQNADQYVEAVRNKFAGLLPEWPKKTKLNAKVTGVIRENNYSIEKIVYESFPGHHVTCNLYLPNGNGPFPAALLFCGHEDLSKATDSYQRTAILFVKNGFAVLVIDPISQSERYQLTDKNGKLLTRGGTTEHTLLNESSNLFGWSTPADELWDNIRGLDYLSTRKEIDMNRVGCLGNSGGGMQTIYFSAFESRIKVIAACSFLMSRERALELTGPSDGCSQIPNEGKAGLEMSDLLIASAPKPVLILAGRYDFIDYTGTTSAYNELKKIYSTLGQGEKAKMFSYDDGHGISLPKREEAVTWFKKWLMNDSSRVQETPLNTLSDKDLFVTKTGQVVTEYPKEVTIAERNSRLFKSSESARKKFLKKDRVQIINQIRDLLAINTDTSSVNIQETGTVIRNNILYHKFILRKQNEVPIPALVIYPESGMKKVILWVHEAGKNKLA